MSPARDTLWDGPKRKPIIRGDYYAALNYTETLTHYNDLVIVKIQVPRDGESGTINPKIDSGAIDDFIDKQFYNKYGSKMINGKNRREIYLEDSKPSAMGLVTHMRKVPMDISRHRELATFQGVNFQNHDVILGMSWLIKHKPTINWNDERITFNSK